MLPLSGSLEDLVGLAEPEVLASAQADGLQYLVDAALAEVLAEGSGHDDQDVHIFGEPLDESEGLRKGGTALEDHVRVLDWPRHASKELGDPEVLLDELEGKPQLVAGSPDESKQVIWSVSEASQSLPQQGGAGWCVPSEIGD
jgi:hypothetical protein